jgi:hypothetical protein
MTEPSNANLPFEVYFDAKVVVTAAEIQGISSTPKVLLGAPPSGTAYIIKSIQLDKPAASTFGGGGGAIDIDYSSPQSMGLSMPSVALTDAADRTEYVEQDFHSTSSNISSLSGLALQISTAGAAFTGGGDVEFFITLKHAYVL